MPDRRCFEALAMSYPGDDSASSALTEATIATARARGDLHLSVYASLPYLPTCRLAQRLRSSGYYRGGIAGDDDETIQGTIRLDCFRARLRRRRQSHIDFRPGTAEIDADDFEA